MLRWAISLTLWFLRRDIHEGIYNRWRSRQSGACERNGAAYIVDETEGFGLNFIEKTERRVWNTTLEGCFIFDQGTVPKAS